MNIIYSKNKPGISNLIDIYSSITGENVHSIVSKFEGKMYSDFKSNLSDVVIDLFLIYFFIFLSCS